VSDPFLFGHFLTHSCPSLKLPLLDATVPSFDDRIQRWLWRDYTRSVQCLAAVARMMMMMMMMPFICSYRNKNEISCRLAHPACFRKALRTLFSAYSSTLSVPLCSLSAPQNKNCVLNDTPINVKINAIRTAKMMNYSLTQNKLALSNKDDKRLW